MSEKAIRRISEVVAGGILLVFGAYCWTKGWEMSGGISVTIGVILLA